MNVRKRKLMDFERAGVELMMDFAALYRVKWQTGTGCEEVLGSRG